MYRTSWPLLPSAPHDLTMHAPTMLQRCTTRTRYSSHTQVILKFYSSHTQVILTLYSIQALPKSYLPGAREPDYVEGEGKRDAAMIERIHRAHGWTDNKMFRNS